MSKNKDDFMGLRHGDTVTEGAWSKLVEALLTLSMRVHLLEQMMGVEADDE